MLITAINKNTCFYVKEELTHSNHKICWKKQTYFSYSGNLIIFYYGKAEHPIFTAVSRTFNLSTIHDLNFMAFDKTANLLLSLFSFFLALCHMQAGSFRYSTPHPTSPKITDFVPVPEAKNISMTSGTIRAAQNMQQLVIEHEY